MSSNPTERLVELQVEAAREAIRLLLLILDTPADHYWETRLTISQQLLAIATTYRNAIPWPGDEQMVETLRQLGAWDDDGGE